MQQVSRFFRQLLVLTGRNFQLIWNNKLVLASLVLQAPLMVGVIFLVGDPDCFTSNLIDVGSRTVLFILAAVSAFMGLLNSYREICKEREIIFREASVGVSLGPPCWPRRSRCSLSRWCRRCCSPPVLCG